MTTVPVAESPRKKKFPPAYMMDVPPRKRSKVSRACDECRRKKIRCDAGLEEDPQCTSCRRAGEKCSFSRIPMKRGPSKKHSWPDPSKSGPDGAKATPSTTLSPPNASVGRNSTSNGSISRSASFSDHTPPSFASPYPDHFRKRAMSSSAGFVLTPAHPGSGPGNTGGAGRVERLPSIDTLTSQHQPPPSPRGSWSSSGTGPRLSISAFPPNSSATFTKAPTDMRARHNSISSVDSAVSPGMTSSMGGGSSIASSSVGSPGPTTLPSPVPTGTSASGGGSGDDFYKRSSSSEVDEPGWEDRYIDTYYQVIHPTVPVLPSSKVRLRARLLACNNPSLRYTLLCALNGLVTKRQRDNARSADYRHQVLMGIMQCASGAEPLGAQSRILHFMTLILLYLQTQESMWLGSAINVSYDIGLHHSERPKGLSDDDYHVSRRLFLVLTFLDRLHANLRQTPVQIPESVIRLNYSTDVNSFSGSRVCLDMIKLSSILGHIGNHPHAHIIKELEGVYQSIEAIWDSTPILKALYYMTMLEAEKHNAGSVGTYANELVTLLESPLVASNPLTTYLIPIVAHTLSPAERRDDRLTQHVEAFERVLEARYNGEFEGVRNLLSQVRIKKDDYKPVSPSSSPHWGLERLAAVAHQAAGL